MKYTTISQPQAAKSREYVVTSGDEISLIAWKLGKRNGSYGVYWRELSRSMGIYDPMQVARVLGADERFLLGERLRIGQRISL